MRATWTCSLLLALVVGLVAGLLISHQTGAAVGQTTVKGRAEPTAGGEPRYSVVATAGHTLIVTDNKTNTLYFYTIDKDKEEYTDLKLRSSVDLSQVGEPVLKPKKAKP